MSENQPDLLDTLSELHETIQKQNVLIEQMIQSQTSFRSRLIAGLWTGLGTVLGATVMVSLLVAVLKPLANIEWISPIVDKVVNDLQTRQPLRK
jgi:hypothetical protein